MWNRSSALSLIWRLQPKLMENGWFVALAGGVLNKGYSGHDLDLVAVPMKTHATDLQKLHEVLVSCDLERTHDAETMREHWKSKGSPDGKYVEVYKNIEGKRVDIIVAYPEGK